MFDREYREMDGCYWAVARNLRISASKIRPVARLVRSQSYPQAVAVLEALPNKGARMLLSVLKSAAANALVVDKMLSEEALKVESICINEATTHKRIWRRGRGRADQQLKRYAHAAVVLKERGH